jgi:hypothetical protein
MLAPFEAIGRVVVKISEARAADADYPLLLVVATSPAVEE